MQVWKKILIALIIVILLWFAFPKTFERFRLEGFEPNRCEKYFEQCFCIGLVNQQESYPPQFNCKGIELCRAIDYTHPAGCEPIRQNNEETNEQNL